MSGVSRWPSMYRRIKAILTSMCAADLLSTVSCTTFRSSWFCCSTRTRNMQCLKCWRPSWNPCFRLGEMCSYLLQPMTPGVWQVLSAELLRVLSKYEILDWFPFGVDYTSSTWWCRNYSNVLCDDEFYSKLSSLIGHLRYQKNMILKMRTTCPKVVDTRWLSISSLKSGWMTTELEVSDFLRRSRQQVPRLRTCGCSCLRCKHYFKMSTSI